MSSSPMLLSDVPVYLQTSFEATAERDQLIDVLSHVEDGAVMSSEDNGIVQKVTIRSGAALRKVADVPNPVRLVPYRGFPEIENIQFRYVVRLHSVKDHLPTVSFTEVEDPLSDHAMRKSLADYLADCGFPVHW